MNTASRQVKIFDTTLRDGQQCPGAGMSFKANLEYVKLAMKLGIDVLEAGFPSASKLDFDIVKTIAEDFSAEKNSPIIAGLCQLRSEQVDITIKALESAIRHKKARLHVYLPVDPELMRASLGERSEDKSGLVKDLYNFVKRAYDAGLEVEFSPEGYSRMGKNFDFTSDLIRAAVEAGATVINCPDTIGGACKLEKETYFVEHMKRHAALIATEYPGKDITWSAHCHNDFGLAVDNTMNAVFFGPARQIEGCINGVGERAGNAALEQCIMVIKHFAHKHNSESPLYTNINTEHLQEVCDFIGTHMLPRQPHWPISGENAAKHSSGGHTNAILSNPMAYQPFDPNEIGKDISFVFGPLSGGNHAKSIINEAGYVCEESEKAEVAQFIKDFYRERRKGITDQELLRAYFEYRKPISVERFDYSKSANTSAVHLTGKFFDETGEITQKHEGRDSALAALKQAVDRKMPGFNIQSHRSNSDGEGVDARSLSAIVIGDGGERVYEGYGDDQDIEISAMKAFIDAVNKAYVEREYRRK